MVRLGLEFLSEGDWRRGLMLDSTLGRRNIVGVDVFCVFRGWSIDGFYV